MLSIARKVRQIPANLKAKSSNMSNEAPNQDKNPEVKKLRQEILQHINSCNTAINTHKKEIARIDKEIDELLCKLQELEMASKK